MKQIRVCSVCGISSDAKRVAHYSKYNKYLCDKHYAQMRKYGNITDPTSRTICDKNEIVKYDDYAEIIIRNKKNEIVAVTKIDLEDVEKVSVRKWNVLPTRSNTYIYSKSPTHLKLHRLILDYYGPKEIDHINRDTLDNRKQNLRVVTRSENASNRTAKHVRLHGKKWEYEIVRYGQRFHECGFDTYEEAEQALQKCLKSVSNRVNELINQFNIQKKNNPYKGVVLHYGKYQAIYYRKGKRYLAGTYNTPEDAYKAREELIATLKNG